jgi:hypothetical protein
MVVAATVRVTVNVLESGEPSADEVMVAGEVLSPARPPEDVFGDVPCVVSDGEALPSVAVPPVLTAVPAPEVVSSGADGVVIIWVAAELIAALPLGAPVIAAVDSFETPVPVADEVSAEPAPADVADVPPPPLLRELSELLTVAVGVALELVTGSAVALAASGLWSPLLVAL